MADNNGNPVPDANVVIMNDNGVVVFRTQTNLTGNVTFDYPGEVTMIAIQKEGYQSDFIVIPKIPDKWVSDIYNSALSGFATGIATAVIGYFRVKKKKRR